MNPERKGTFTTNVLAYVDDHPLALYFIGWQHAGENLAAVLAAWLRSQLAIIISGGLSPRSERDELGNRD
jgi:hypothetical protein